jgi:hypothetical protein
MSRLEDSLTVENEDTPSGKMRSNMNEYEDARSGDKSFAMLRYQVDADTYAKVQGYMMGYDPYNNYSLGYNDCVHAAALSYGGVSQNFIYAMPWVHPHFIDESINKLNQATSK